MSDFQRQLEWEKISLERFEIMIKKLPLFHRGIANEIVLKKAEINAKDRESKIVEEKDIVSAFFTEVPKAFYSLMIRLLDETGFNYQEFIPKGDKK